MISQDRSKVNLFTSNSFSLPPLVLKRNSVGDVMKLEGEKTPEIS